MFLNILSTEHPGMPPLSRVVSPLPLKLCNTHSAFLNTGIGGKITTPPSMSLIKFRSFSFPAEFVFLVGGMVRLNGRPT